MINVNKVLDEAIEKDASDIHFIIENKPMLRISRELIPSENADVLTEEDMNEIYDYLISILNLYFAEKSKHTKKF